MLIVIPADADKPYDTFTCKHWDRETRLCKDYENRPKMCSGYPDDARCKFCGFAFACGSDDNYQTLYPLPRLEAIAEAQRALVELTPASAGIIDL